MAKPGGLWRSQHELVKKLGANTNLWHESFTGMPLGNIFATGGKYPAHGPYHSFSPQPLFLFIHRLSQDSLDEPVNREHPVFGIAPHQGKLPQIADGFVQF